MNLGSFMFSRSHLPLNFSIRCVSSKYIKPHPRPYRRRLYEAAMAPILPQTVKQCNIAEVLERLNFEKNSFADIELAEVKEIKRWMKEHEFRVMVVCQMLSVKGRTLWITRNQLRLAGIEFREIENKISKKLFENTPLASLQPLWCGSNAFLFGKDLDAIDAVIAQTNKLSFLIPLVVTFDDRIIPINESKDITRSREILVHHILNPRTYIHSIEMASASLKNDNEVEPAKPLA